MESKQNFNKQISVLEKTPYIIILNLNENCLHIHLHNYKNLKPIYFTNELIYKDLIAKQKIKSKLYYTIDDIYKNIASNLNKKILKNSKPIDQIII